MSSFNCFFLTCIQISQEARQVFWYSHLLKNFPQFVLIHTAKIFGIVNKAEVDVFLELSCFFNDPTDVGNLISGSSAFSKSSLNIWRFMVHVLLKPGLENFERYFASMRDDCNCVVVWMFFGIAFLWDWNENQLFPVQYEKAKYRTLKVELPWLVGAQYATGDQWRNNSRKNEEMELKQQQHPVVDVTGDGKKVWCCKEQYCIGTWK